MLRWKLQAHNLEFLGAEHVFLRIGALDKHFMCEIQKKGSAGKNVRVFSPGYP